MQNPNSHSIVVNALCGVVGRIVKVTWLKDLRERKLLENMSCFFMSNHFCQKVGLDLLIEITTQMNQFIPCLIFLFLFTNSNRNPIYLSQFSQDLPRCSSSSNSLKSPLLFTLLRLSPYPALPHSRSHIHHGCIPSPHYHSHVK